MKPDNRIIELCDRLTSAGHAPSKLSASEFHELADFIYGLPETPKIVCICGSSRFVAECAVKAWELSKEGIIALNMPLLPIWYKGVVEHHQAEAEGVAKVLDELWLKKIELADEILIMNVGGYIGDRTRIEINHAEQLGKPITYHEPL
jgi:hypothetical protein